MCNFRGAHYFSLSEHTLPMLESIHRYDLEPHYLQLHQPDKSAMLEHAPEEHCNIFFLHQTNLVAQTYMGASRTAVSKFSTPLSASHVSWTWRVNSGMSENRVACDCRPVRGTLNRCTRLLFFECSLQPTHPFLIPIPITPLFGGVYRDPINHHSLNGEHGPGLKTTGGSLTHGHPGGCPASTDFQ